ncbi:MAG: hypothetical protein IKY60_03955 [Bacteroidales bacterium]|nr:hypothetical protein [Bacteroidales bacterium]
MNTIKNLLGGGRYESPEMTVVELQLEGAVLSGSGDQQVPQGAGIFGNLEYGTDVFDN